jgi:DNA-binding XRE family transcriptional regulator
MRRAVADWGAGLLALAVLAFGGLIVLKPAVDHWDDVYRADPFGGGATTRTIERSRPAREPGAQRESASSGTSTGAGASGSTTSTSSGNDERPVERSSSTRTARTRTTVTIRTEEAPFLERTLGKGGLLLLRLAVVALAALLVGAVAQRALTGDFGLRPRRRAAVAPAGGYASSATGELEPAEDPEAETAPIPNGRDTPEEANGASLAGAIAMLVASRREELGISQRELAKRAGISHTVISRIEGGEHSPSPKTLERLTEALGIGPLSSKQG